MMIIGTNHDAGAAEKEECYGQLPFLLEQVGNRKEINLLGDLNGRVGSKVSNEVLGKFGEGVVNDNGVRYRHVSQNK